MQSAKSFRQWLTVVSLAVLVMASTALAAPPAISSLSPASATVGGAAFTLTINGSNFSSTTTAARWGATALKIAYKSATQLTAAVPASLIAAVGTASVTVTTASGASSAAVFTVSPAQPAITSLSPATATAGGAAFTLTITGRNFTSANNIVWVSTYLATTYISSTQLKATVPASLIASAGTVSVMVRVPGTGTFSPVPFTINSAPPAITSLSPATATAGGAAFTLTITGSNFTSTSTSKWGTTALNTTYKSATQLTAAVPASLIAAVGTASVTVTTVSGASSAAVFTVNPPLPAISNLSPAAATAGGAAFTLTITGRNFTSTSTSKWGTTALNSTYKSATQLTAAVPASLIAAVGTASVTVTSISGASSVAVFTINPPQPAITSLSPAAATAGGAAFTLTINGSNFTSANNIVWGSTYLATTYISSTQLKATVPASLIAIVGTVSVMVRIPGTGTFSPVPFTINSAPPAVTSLSPASATAGGAAFTLTINGTNFTSASTSKWGSTTLNTTYKSTTQLTAAVPASLIAAVGTASVTVSTAGGTSLPAAVTVTLPPPAITSMNPTLAIAGSAFTLTINGANFTSDSTSKLGATVLKTTYKSATQLTAAVPASLVTTAGKASVTVSTSSGVSAEAALTVNLPAPTITSLNPVSTIAGSAAFTLAINGSNFTSAATLNWGSTPLTTTYVSASKLTTSVPASLVASAGTASVTITTVSGTSPGAAFTVNPPPPTITSLSQVSAVAGDAAFTMTINGANYLPGALATVVRFGSTPLTTTYVSSTQLMAAVPASLLIQSGTLNISVVTAGGTSSAVPFTIKLAPPTIIYLSPAQVPAGFGAFVMKIFGANFQTTPAVYWGTTPLVTTGAWNILEATVPASLVAAPGTASVTVVTAGGTSAPATFTITTPQPVITSLSSASVSAGSDTFTLTINGSNFTTANNIVWESTYLATTYVSTTQLKATVPASLIATAGMVSVMVRVPGIGTFSPVFFTISQAPPSTTSLSPASATAGGAGFMLTIKGTAFTQGSTSMWGTTSLGTIYVSPTQLIAAIPASLIQYAGTGNVTVSSTAGTSAPVAITINQALPAITSLTPSLAAAGGATFFLAISGEYFTPATITKWGSTVLTTTYVSATQLTAAVPASLIATAGVASVTVRTPGIGTSAPAAISIVSNPALKITTATLPSATAANAYSGPINVTGGAPGYTWTVTGLPDSLTFFNTSDNTLTITGTPASPGVITFQVSVQDTAGTNVGPVTYTINVAAGPNGANNGNLNGSYACLFQGFIDDDGSRWATVASFQADGQGNFTSGIFDTNGVDTGSALGMLTGSYNIGSDNNGLASIRTVLTDGAAGIQTKHWALAISTSAQPAQQFTMVEADDLGTLSSSQHGTANCHLATASAFTASAISGKSFVFGLDGEDGDGNLKAAVGLFSASSGKITSGNIDTAQGGNATAQTTAFTGIYTAPDPATGRFTIALNGAGNSTGLTVYMIDASRMFILDNTTNDGEQAGSARVQQQAAYSGANLNGPFVLYRRGAEFNSGPGSPTGYYADVFGGEGDGAGNITIGQSYTDDDGVYSAGDVHSGPVALAFDPANPGRITYPTASGTVFLYLFDTGSAMEMSVNANGSVDSGWLEPQTQTTFTGAALAGNYLSGELPLLSQAANGSVGVYGVSGTGAIISAATIAGEEDLSWDQSNAMTYAWDASAPGMGTFLVANGAQGAASCAVINATRFVCASQTDPAPSIQVMQQ